MQNDPLTNWQSLTELYGKMYDGELLNLAADSADLTEEARQVLANEMRKRDLGQQHSEGKAFDNSDGSAIARSDPGVELADTGGESEQQTDVPSEYTWKTVLCECENSEEALQLSEVLTRAGIESWIERPGARHPVVWNEQMVGNLQILVAADQLDRAREIAAQPIPQEIVEQSRIVDPEFELPPCPACGAPDPTLEGADLVNNWRCEACGHQWTESPADLTPDKIGK